MFDLLNHYGKAGQELREGELITSNKPYRSDDVNEERIDVTTNTVNIVQRPWNDKTDEQDYQRDMAIYSKEEAQYLKDKANLWIFIISNLTASVHSRIKVKLSYKEIQSTSDVLRLWKLLFQTVKVVGANAGPGTRQHWHTLRQVDPETGSCKSLIEFLIEFENLLSILKGTESEPTDNEKVHQLIAAIKPQKYAYVTTPIITQRIKTITYQKLKDELMRLEEANLVSEEVFERDPSVAMQVKEGEDILPNKRNKFINKNNYKNKNKNNNNKEGRTFKSNNHTIPTCFNCDRKGHNTRECNKNPVICNYCKGKYHMEKYCFKKSKNEDKETQKPSTNQPNNNNNIKKVTFKQPKVNAVINTDKETYQEEWTDDEEPQELSNTMRGLNTFPVLSTKIRSKQPIEILIDSGASIHVFNDINIPNVHTETKPVADTASILGINGEKLKVSGRGFLKGIGRYYVVPGAAANLLSVAEMTKRGSYSV